MHNVFFIFRCVKEWERFVGFYLRFMLLNVPLKKTGTGGGQAGVLPQI